MTARWHRWRQPQCQTGAGNENEDSIFEHCPQTLCQEGTSSVRQLAWESNVFQLYLWKLRAKKLDFWSTVGFGEQRWCSGESPRFPTMWDRHYIRVEIVGSLPCSLFPGIPLFSPGRTTTFDWCRGSILWATMIIVVTLVPCTYRHKGVIIVIVLFLIYVVSNSGADQLEHATPILSLCQGIFTDWSIFSTPFLS